MATVRDILADNPSGISRPGLLAWSRLRIDPAMTDEQLEEAIRLLGDDVVEREGFLYLRGAAGAYEAPGTDWSGAADSGWEGAAEPPAAAFDESAGAAWPTEPETSATPSSWIAPSGGVGRTARILISVLAVIFGVGTLVMGLLGAAFDDSSSGDPGGGGAGTVVGADRMAVGDCFEIPTGDEFTEVLILDCSLSHGGEVFHIADYEGDPGGYPTGSLFDSWALATCDPAFADYTGSRWEEQDELDWSWFAPTESGWDEGDREMACWLFMADGSEATRSYRGANP
jgi:hypothetical protein